MVRRKPPLVATWDCSPQSQATAGRPTPIYRAVLVAGVLALPFDLFSSYMFYNLRAFRPAAMRLDIRPIAIGVHLVALVWLYLDLPLLFLCTVLAPRIWVT